MNKQSERQARYDSANTIRVTMKLNKKTDAAIIERLNEQPSKQGYIKRLIKEDIQMTAGQREIKKLERQGYEITHVNTVPGVMRIYTLTAVRHGTARDPFGNATGPAEYIKEFEVAIYDDGEVSVERTK